MNVSYKSLWKILEDKKMKKKDLIKIANISKNCVANRVTINMFQWQILDVYVKP